MKAWWSTAVFGRPRTMIRRAAPERTAALFRGQNTDLPVCSCSTTTSQIDEHAKLPVDIQVSGHVHNGQVAPANLIVRQMNRLAYGYQQIGNGHFFVTSGFGFSGRAVWLGFAIGSGGR